MPEGEGWKAVKAWVQKGQKGARARGEEGKERGLDEVLAMAMKMRKRAKERKREEVERLKSMLNAYKTVAIVNFRGLRARQFQEIRRDFRGKCIICLLYTSPSPRDRG